MGSISARAILRYALLTDGSLEIETEGALYHAISRWLPLSRDLLEAENPADRAGKQSGSVPARIRVRGGESSGRAPNSDGAPEEPLLRLWSVGAWRANAPRTFILSSKSGISGHVDLDGGDAELVVPVPVTAAARRSLFSALTLAAALLLLGERRALMHAAAVAPISGKAMLLAGDARSGKSTSVANLMAAGWEYLSDDQIVLREAVGGVVVEGWPRRFHLDTGWREARVTGRREAVDPARVGTGSFRRSAELGAGLFARVAPGEGTRLEPIPSARALALLIRQSPWLLVDAPSASAVLSCLTRAASLPAYRLALDHDTYGDPERLARLIAPLARE